MEAFEKLRRLIGLGGEGQHTLKLGEPGPDDIILYQEKYRKGDKVLSKVRHTFTYTAKDNEEITAVSAEDQWLDDTGGNPLLISGGVGQREVTIQVTSQRNRGFHFHFYVYGVRKEDPLTTDTTSPATADEAPLEHVPAAAEDGLLIQQHIFQQGSLNMGSLKMLLCGLPCTGKTTAMLRLSNQLQCLDPNDYPRPSTGFEKPQTVELYKKQSVMIVGAEWRYHDLKQQGETLYSRILKSSSNNTSSLAMTSSSQSDAATASSFPQSDAATAAPFSQSDIAGGSGAEMQTSIISSAALREPQAVQQAVLTSLVKAQDWDAVREKLKAVEDVTILHIMDCGGHPECHEILPLLLEGQALSLVFLNLTHDLDKTYKVVFRGDRGLSSIQYESVFTAREVLQRTLCSISSLQSGAHKEKPVALLVGSYLDQSNEEAVLTLNKSIEEALKSFIEKDILFPANDQEGKYIATLDNMSEDQEDIKELRRMILTIIETRFQSKPIPTAWLLLHLLLRDKYEEDPGWCTVEECVKVAVACGIKEEELLGEDGILRYIHKQYGTLLYYPKVDGLCGKVICDPNVILRPFTQTFLLSFACNRGYKQTAKSIRATGEIPHDLMETICAANSADPIPTSEIVALFKERYILYESVLTAKGTKSYFMPCLLQPDPSAIENASDPTTLSFLSPAPLQLVPHSTGYVPLGLFPALVVKMSHIWSLHQRDRFRNSIQFHVIQEGKPTRRVQLRQYPSYLELRLLHEYSEQTMDLSILTICRQQLWEALHQVCSEYPHMKDIVWRFGFYCLDSLQPGRQPHSAVCMTNEDPVDMLCLHEPCCDQEVLCLEDKHKSWFKSVAANGVPLKHVPGLNFESVDGTTVLNEDDIHNVKSAVVDLAAKWQGLGDTLGVRPGDLDTILADNPHFCSDRLRSVLMQWLRQNHMVEKFGKPTWRGLVKAVEALEQVGGSNPGLAQRIARDHPAREALPTAPH